MITVDIIICTYNRPNQILFLVNEINNATKQEINIFVIDSSDSPNIYLNSISNVIYLQSNHKNQPYQRLLGTQASKADYVLFLDDDMEVANANFLGIITRFIEQHAELSGISIFFEDKHTSTSLAQIPTTQLNTISKYLRWFTGYGLLPEGKLGLCGIRGKQPDSIQPTELTSGGAFVAKRDLLFKNFNFQLFDLFESKIGMGEDVILGYGLSKKGFFYRLPELLFFHNDPNNSSYSSHLESYSFRVTYSRLYLSLEKLRLDNKSLLFGYIHFHWYTLWRCVGFALNYILSPSSSRKLILKGSLFAWIKSIQFKFTDLNNRKEYWLKEVKKNK